MHAFSELNYGELYTLRILGGLTTLNEACLIYNFQYYRQDKNQSVLDDKYRLEQTSQTNKKQIEQVLQASVQCSKVLNFTT